MTTVEIKAQKAELIQSILNDINNEDMILELKKLVRRMTEKRPCQYTIEELKAGVDDFIREFENDELIPHEELKKRFQA